MWSVQENNKCPSCYINSQEQSNSVSYSVYGILFVISGLQKLKTCVRKVQYYTSISNYPIRKLSLCHMSIELITILRLTYTFIEPTFHMTMAHPMFPGEHVLGHYSRKPRETTRTTQYGKKTKGRDMLKKKDIGRKVKNSHFFRIIYYLHTQSS